MRGGKRGEGELIAYLRSHDEWLLENAKSFNSLEGGEGSPGESHEVKVPEGNDKREIEKPEQRRSRWGDTFFRQSEKERKRAICKMSW